jgi:CO/xanthine dehydrogenase Mo-binding subunit
VASLSALHLHIRGVRSTITKEEVGAVPRIPLRLRPLPGAESFLEPVIAADRVRYVGEPVAVVLADKTALARAGSARSDGTADQQDPVRYSSRARPLDLISR